MQSIVVLRFVVHLLIIVFVLVTLASSALLPAAA